MNEKHIRGIQEYWEEKMFAYQFWGFVVGMVLGILLSLIWLK